MKSAPSRASISPAPAEDAAGGAAAGDGGLLGSDYEQNSERGEGAGQRANQPACSGRGAQDRSWAANGAERGDGQRQQVAESGPAEDTPLSENNQRGLEGQASRNREDGESAGPGDGRACADAGARDARAGSSDRTGNSADENRHKGARDASMAPTGREGGEERKGDGGKVRRGEGEPAIGDRRSSRRGGKERAHRDRREKSHGERDRREREADRGREKARGRGGGERDRRDRDRERERDRNVGRDRERDGEHAGGRGRGPRERDRGDRKRDRPDRERERSRDWRGDRGREKARDRDRDRRQRPRSASRSKLKASAHQRSASRGRHRWSRSRSRSRSGKRYRRDQRDRRGRRRSRSASGDYGGYVPRKRQEPPQPGAAGYSNSNDPFYYLRQGGTAAADPQEALRQWQEQQLRSRQLVLQQQAVSAAAAASKTQREVYVGNLVPGLVSEAALRQLFDSALAAAFPDSANPGMEPVISVSMHSDGRYAFVELRTPEMATSALQLSGQVQLFGQSISVGRPSGYVDPSKAAAAAQAAAAALAAFSAGDTSAAAALGNVVPVQSPTAAASPAGVSPMGVLTGSALAATPATSYLCLEGTVSGETLTVDEDYMKAIKNLKDECVKYGQVVQLKIPRPADAKMAHVLYGTGFYGKAFVQFADAGAAARAKEALTGMILTGGQGQVAVAYVTQEVFAAII